MAKTISDYGKNDRRLWQKRPATMAKTTNDYPHDTNQKKITLSQLSSRQITTRHYLMFLSSFTAFSSLCRSLQRCRVSRWNFQRLAEPLRAYLAGNGRTFQRPANNRLAGGAPETARSSASVCFFFLRLACPVSKGLTRMTVLPHLFEVSAWHLPQMGFICRNDLGSLVGGFWNITVLWAFSF